MEFCRIVKEQKVKDWKINQDRKKEMIRITAEKPGQRFTKIEEFVSLFDVLSYTFYRSCHENFTCGR